MTQLLAAAAERAMQYLEGLDRRSVAPSPHALAQLERFDEALPEEPTDPETVLQMLDELGSPATVASAGRRYFGFVIGGSLPAALAANWLAAAWDQNAALTVSSPAAAAIEQIALRWLIELFGLPSDCGAAFVTGATMANFTSLAAARHAVLQKVGWEVEAQGLFGAPPITVLVGAEAHASLFKALGMLGLGRSRFVKVPVDQQGRMRADALPPLSGPTIVCLQAGNVNSGAFDPATEVVARAHAAGAWVHVDGAFGLWAAAAPKRAYLMEGVSGADSWATDAHKWLNVPYDSGLAFVRDSKTLSAAMGVSAAYLLEGDKREPSRYTPELSRRARGIEIWAALRSLGRSGLADLIERDCQFADRFAKGLAEAGFEILNDVVLNQVMVAFGDEAKTRRVIDAIQADGTCWCGSTTWQGRTAMRISVSSWATTAEDIERSLDAMRRAAAGQNGTR
jgi:glutamate/tyrosine decarboxylase-like PLP-dependent enzyme